MEENQHHLYISCVACKGNFVVPNFWYLFWNCLEKWINLFLPKQCPKFQGLLGDAFRTMIHLFHRRYHKIYFFQKFYSCVVCTKISVTILRNWPCFIWSIAIAKLWMFLRWTDTDPSFRRKSYKITVYHFE